MNGLVDLQGRALLTMPIRNSPDGQATPVEFWVDTGFTGDLVLPKAQIEQLGLVVSSIIPTILADGREADVESFVAGLDWFGELQEVEVCASSGQNVLLGVRLMLGHRLVVDYNSTALSLE